MTDVHGMFVHDYCPSRLTTQPACIAQGRTASCDRSDTKPQPDDKPANPTLRQGGRASSWSVLPPELLNRIFACCLEDDPDFWPTLCLVNGTWRDVVQSHRNLWQSLKLSDADFDAVRLRRKADLWMSRSGNLPVDVEFNMQYGDSILPLLSYTAPFVDRWRNVRYKLGSVYFVDALDDEKPELELLSVTMYPTDSLASDVPTFYGTERTVNSSFKWQDWGSRIHSDNKGRLSAISVSDLLALPPPGVMAPLNSITHLFIQSRSLMNEIPAHQLVQFLTALPALKWLEMGHLHLLNPEYRPDCQEIIPVELPNLQSLNIKNIISSRCFISHVITPQLCTLKFTHVNTARVFDHPYPEESGDSDDEAHDYSRSPWSDHATGMGLRNLFSRCTPPLGELVLDYADLRTKDFIWAFEKMRSLERLTIVASDMSDNVARALVPVGDWLPLPALAHLRLEKCHKLSGSAITNMIKTRINAAAAGLMTPLQTLEIISCEGFLQVQFEEIVEVFQPRSGLTYVPDDGEHLDDANDAF